MYSKSKTFSQGSFDILPLMIPVVPFGIIFGAIGIELGFGPYVTYATSKDVVLAKLLSFNYYQPAPHL